MRVLIELKNTSSNAYIASMISHELRAQASLAYQNWKIKNPQVSLPISEEDFVIKFENLQSNFNKGLISRQDFDTRIDELLTNPAMAVNVTHFEPVQKSTDALLRELEGLKKSGILTDEQFQERKSELFFQRDVDEDAEDAPATSAPDGETMEEKKQRLAAYLEELLQSGILTHAEYEMAKSRLKA